MAALRIGLLCIFLLAACNGMTPSVPEKPIGVGELLQVVNLSYKQASDLIAKDGNKLPSLDSATLTLQTKTVISGGVTLDLAVVSVSGKQENASTQTLTVKLVKPAGPFALVQREQDDLVKAIRAAAVAAKEAIAAQGPDLEFDSVTVSVGFDVTRSGGAGLKLEIPAVVKIGPSVSLGITGSHKVDLVFKRPSTKPKPPGS